MQSFEIINPDSKPASSFNPYIHGTNSYILPLLEKGEMQMLSPIEMIRKYQIAPLGGEISGGGLDRVHSDTMPCFGRLSTDKTYSLAHIIDRYTTYKSICSPTDWQRLYLHGFSNINVFLIYLTRAKQLGRTTKQIFKDEEITTLYEQMNATIQFYYLIMLLGKHIHPHFELLKSLNYQETKDTEDAIYTHLTFENLLNRIMQKKLDIASIYINPTPDSLNQIEQLLALPKTSIIKSGISGKDKEVTLSETHLFTAKETQYPKTYDYYEVGYLFYRLPQNCEGYAINDVLERFANRKISQKFLQQFEEKILTHIDALNDRFSLLKTIIDKDYSKDIIEKNSLYLAKPFPLVLICEDDNKLELLSAYSDEYRAKSPLKFGKDITMIATDTMQNKMLLKNYFEKQGIYNMEIISFDQLKQSKKTGIRPEDTSNVVSTVSMFSKPTDLSLVSEGLQTALSNKWCFR